MDEGDKPVERLTSGTVAGAVDAVVTVIEGLAAAF